jgi:MFS superfamily sulfate permease-like transporter
VIVGIVIGVLFVIYQNAKGAVIITREAGQAVLMRFRRDGTFVSKPGILAALESVQAGERVVIDATGEYIDHDVKEMIAGFMADAPTRNIYVELRGLDMAGVSGGGGH